MNEFAFGSAILTIPDIIDLSSIDCAFLNTVINGDLIDEKIRIALKKQGFLK